MLTGPSILPTIKPIDIFDKNAPMLPIAVFEHGGTYIEGLHLATLFDGRVAIQMDATMEVYLCNEDYVYFDEQSE